MVFRGENCDTLVVIGDGIDAEELAAILTNMVGKTEVIKVSNVE